MIHSHPLRLYPDDLCFKRRYLLELNRAILAMPYILWAARRKGVPARNRSKQGRYGLLESLSLVLNPDGQVYLEATNNWWVAPSLKLRIESFKVRKTDEIDKAFAAIAKSRVDALLLKSDPRLQYQPTGAD